MWSDRIGTAARETLVHRLREILPAPRSAARSEVIPLDWRQTTAEVAAGWRRHGLMWLDRPRTELFANPLATISVTDRHATIQGPAGTVHWRGGGLDVIEAALEAWSGPAEARLCGYLGYELGLELEDIAPPWRQEADLPDLYLRLYDRRLEYNGGIWELHGTDAWRPVSIEPVLSVGRGDGGLAAGPVASTPDAEGFCAAVGRTVQRIYSGELFQVNLCRRLETALPDAHAWQFYQRLRTITPATYAAFLEIGEGPSVLSSSPELFLSVEQGRVRSCPIKGTRPRGGTAQEDGALARELQASEKDRAELAMIVDVTRNDLGRVCQVGSVKVARHAELMTLPTVHHTFSEVTGILPEDRSAADLLRACFPPASITGAPKIRAMEIAVEEERHRRGPAMGAIGWIGLSGDLELSVAIRTAAVSQGRLTYLAGCGITAGSVPEQELEEAEAKAVAFRRALAALGSGTACCRGAAT